MIKFSRSQGHCKLGNIYINFNFNYKSKIFNCIDEFDPLSMKLIISSAFSSTQKIY